MSEDGLILLAEDQEDDVLLIRRAFSRGKISNPLQVVRDGKEVVEYLKGEGRFSSRSEYPLPELLLLDLKMPRMNGFDVLRWIRRQPSLSRLRVLVLTASDAVRDVNLAYSLGANSFLVKPIEFENCVELGEIIREYWLRASKTPQIEREYPSMPIPPRSAD